MKIDSRVLVSIWNFIFRFSGLGYIWHMIVKPYYSEDNQKPSNFPLWIFGIYVAAYGLAEARYESKVRNSYNLFDKYDSYIKHTITTKTLQDFLDLQNKLIPHRPEIFRPFSVIKSLSSKYDKRNHLLKVPTSLALSSLGDLPRAEIYDIDFGCNALIFAGSQKKDVLLKKIEVQELSWKVVEQDYFEILESTIGLLHIDYTPREHVRGNSRALLELRNSKVEKFLVNGNINEEILPWNFEKNQIKSFNFSNLNYDYVGQLDSDSIRDISLKNCFFINHIMSNKKFDFKKSYKMLSDEYKIKADTIKVDNTTLFRIFLDAKVLKIDSSSLFLNCIIKSDTEFLPRYESNYFINSISINGTDTLELHNLDVSELPNFILKNGRNTLKIEF